MDPIRNFVDKPKVFEPPPHDKYNRMAYVLAFEEDGWARDVTQRFCGEHAIFSRELIDVFQVCQGVHTQDVKNASGRKGQERMVGHSHGLVDETISTGEYWIPNKSRLISNVAHGSIEMTSRM